MDILIDVNGTIYSVPLSGETIFASKPTLRIRCAGLLNNAKGLTRRELAQARQDRIYANIPAAPAYATVESITEALPDVSHDLVRKSLLRFQKQGKIISVRPPQIGHGQSARRWMRVL